MIHTEDKIKNNAQKTDGFLQKQAVCLYIATKKCMKNIFLQNTIDENMISYYDIDNIRNKIS